jgi:hypothetical protein
VDWPRLVRKYVWDEERTPYLVASDRLTPKQIRSELFVYAFMLAILASVVALLAAVGEGIGMAGPAPFVAAYAFTIAVAAMVVGITGHPAAAAYCATAPVAVGLAAAARVLRPGMVTAEAIVIGALSLLWLAYALRAVRVARALRRQA